MPTAGALEVMPINLPRPLFHDGQRLPASYMNFYIANGVVLVPVFDDVADLEACDTLAALFPAGTSIRCERSIWPGGWGPFTASRSSSRHWPTAGRLKPGAFATVKVLAPPRPLRSHARQDRLRALARKR